MVGVDGLEPSTSPLSEVRSNQLSYTPTYMQKSFCKSKYINSNYKIKIFSKKNQKSNKKFDKTKVIHYSYSVYTTIQPS